MCNLKRPRNLMMMNIRSLSSPMFPQMTPGVRSRGDDIRTVFCHPSAQTHDIVYDLESEIARAVVRGASCSVVLPL
jgi:hypothetical protein